MIHFLAGPRPRYTCAGSECTPVVFTYRGTIILSRILNLCNFKLLVISVFWSGLELLLLLWYEDFSFPLILSKEITCRSTNSPSSYTVVLFWLFSGCCNLAQVYSSTRKDLYDYDDSWKIGILAQTRSMLRVTLNSSSMRQYWLATDCFQSPVYVTNVRYNRVWC